MRPRTNVVTRPGLQPCWPCPICGERVEEGGAACGACPMGRGCGLLCCPRCGYRFAERSASWDLLSRLWPGRIRKEES